MQDPDTITVNQPTVTCDGGTLGHPAVYLNLGPKGEIDCPYCGCHFVLADDAQSGSGH
jgi:uncharacterized Zn-finger protein